MYAFELIPSKFSHLLHFGLHPLLASCHLENLDGVFEVVIMDIPHHLVVKFSKKFITYQCFFWVIPFVNQFCCC